MYSHRSTVLHAFAACAADALRSEGARLDSRRGAALSRQRLEPAVLRRDVRREARPARAEARSGKHLHAARARGMHQGVRHSDDLAQFPRLVEANKAKLDLSRLKLEQVVSGGSAPPRATIEKFRDLIGVFLLQAWGMTERARSSPSARRWPNMSGLSAGELVDVQVKQGRQVFGIDLKLVGRDGSDLPHDGVSVGELKVRGNWVISGYFKGEGGRGGRQGRLARHRRRRHDRSRRLRAAHRPPEGRHQVGRRVDFLDRDREPRHVASRRFRGRGHRRRASGVAGAPAADRPSARRAKPTKAALLKFLSERLAKWQIPDDVVFVDACRIRRPASCSRRSCARDSTAISRSAAEAA